METKIGVMQLPEMEQASNNGADPTASKGITTNLAWRN